MHNFRCNYLLEMHNKLRFPGTFPVFLRTNAEDLPKGFCEIAGGFIPHLVADLGDRDAGRHQQMRCIQDLGILRKLINALAHLCLE